ncbi:MAG: cysteine--tRNA ligase [candidate division WOR-3 bacterium]|nr:cysteine--tRNA ligase [candidate division WOR-3 bacterium]MCX7948222.1 cysteine--tRNA ligase [candidate division WOR-3 bacterium]MDW8150024.1 cysteine--tRNA ligase [candidate division WOR-3 bacterium]
MKLYDTYTSSIREFKPIDGNNVKVYVCGMTVQDSPHAGHLRTFTSFDILRRYLEYKGYKVSFVQNFTDIDDKIINKSKELGIDWRKIAYKYEQEYIQYAKLMNFKEPDFYPKATLHIQEIIEIIQSLINKGFAYVSNGNVWFDVSKFESYGKLSKKTIEELISGYRIEPDSSKKNPYDFALWKAYKENEPYWYAPFGRGRPGWHIECSAMVITHLGETVDIHGGAEDLIFPHHENEIAQSETYTNKKFSNFWIHTGFLNIKGEKMSKSTGIFLSAKDLLENYEPNVVRLFYIKAHYRTPLDFSEELLNDAKNSWNRVKNFLLEYSQDGKILTDILYKFEEAMDDNLNTPKAISVIFDAINLAYKNREIAIDVSWTIRFLLSILGFDINFQRTSNRLNEIMDIIIEIRHELRKNAQFELSDRIRTRLKDMGIVLEDTKEGTKWKVL